MKLRFSILHGIAALALAVSLAACSSPSSVTVSQPLKTIGQPVTGDTIGGVNHPLNGYLQADHTYYMDSSVIIPAGDTLLIQKGVTVIVLNTGISNAAGAPEFQVFGSMICNGVQGDPIYLTVPANLRKYADLTNVNSGSLWGGIQCAGPSTTGVTNGGSGDLAIKWTHIEFAGGSAAQDDPIVKGGGTRYAVWYQNPNGHFVMEDSWITGSTDDPLRVSGGKIAIFRNVIECAAPTSGDFNFKTGTVGDIAYNLCIGICTNGPKLANTNGINPQCNVNIYNNTIVTCGWRCTKSGRSGSTDIEDGARGTEFNNLIVNCRTGFRLDANPIADTANTYYGYQWYYGSVDTIVSLFYPPDGVIPSTVADHDVHGAAGQKNPEFVGYNVDQFPSTLWNTFPIGITSQLPAENLMRTMDEKGNSRFVDLQGVSFKSDFHLQPNSPCVGTAFTGPVKDKNGSTIAIPMGVVPTATSSNLFGVDNYAGLGKDFGAYQQDGSGNQQ